RELPPAGEHPDQAEAGADLPDPAAALAEVADRHPVVAVATRFQAHPFEQLGGAALVLAAPRGPRAELLHARREPVARALQLAESGQARPGGGGRPLREGGGRSEVGEAVGEDRGELVLELRDLRPERGPGGALGGGRRLGRRPRCRDRGVQRLLRLGDGSFATGWLVAALEQIPLLRQAYASDLTIAGNPRS